MAVTFTLRTLIAAPPATVFAAALDVDEHVRSMAGSGEAAVAGVTTGRLGAGETVTWRARHFGVVWTMTSRIMSYEPPSLFVDEQEHGPFRSFRHVHRFRPVGAGTEMLDDVEFVAPLGPLGVLVERAVLARYLRRLIARRNEYLKSAIEEGRSGSGASTDLPATGP